MESTKTTNTPALTNTYVSVASVAKRFEISKNTVWRWSREGTFPKPVQIGLRCTRWKLSEIEEWEEQS